MVECEEYKYISSKYFDLWILLRIFKNRSIFKLRANFRVKWLSVKNINISSKYFELYIYIFFFLAFRAI